MSFLKEINKDRINWKIEFLKNGLESVEDSLHSGQKLDKVDIEFLEEESKNLRQWIKDLQEELKDI